MKRIHTIPAIIMLIVFSLLLFIPLELNAHTSMQTSHYHGHTNHNQFIIQQPYRPYNPPNTIIYHGPSYYYPKAYWSGWTPYYYRGYTCQKRCLINRYTGAIVQCVKRCY
jgi:hypothetical protein